MSAHIYIINAILEFNYKVTCKFNYKIIKNIKKTYI